MMDIQTASTNNDNNNDKDKGRTDGRGKEKEGQGWFGFLKGSDRDKGSDKDKKKDKDERFLRLFPNTLSATTTTDTDNEQGLGQGQGKKWPWEVYYRGEIPFFENKNITAGGTGLGSSSNIISYDNNYDGNNYDDIDYTLPINPATAAANEAVTKGAVRVLNFWRTAKKGVSPKRRISLPKGKNDMITALMVQELEDVPVTESEVRCG